MNEAPYPRPTPEPEHRSGCGRKAWGGFLVLASVAGCCAFSVAQMIAEGPHGPHGEITNDPSAPRTILAIVIVSLVAFGYGFRLLGGRFF